MYKSYPLASVAGVSVQSGAPHIAALRMRGCSSTTGPGHLLGTGANMATQPLSQPGPPWALSMPPSLSFMLVCPNVTEGS